MGIMDEEIWQCENCGFEFVGISGLFEADPNDFGTTHHISPHHCPKCGNLKNLSSCIGFVFESPQEGNKKLCRHDTDTCDICGTKMQDLKKPETKIFQKSYLCPKCKKKKLKFSGNGSNIWT